MGVHRLVPANAVAYRELMLEAYERHPDAFTSSAAERSALPLSWWEARLSEVPEAPDVVLGTFHEQRLIGVVGLSFQTREKARHKATLFGMYVPAEFRHRGLGRKLVWAALQYAQRRPGAKIIQLTVTHGNVTAQALYVQCGFIEFGLEPFAVAVGTQFVSKVHMWRKLDNHA